MIDIIWQRIRKLFRRSPEAHLAFDLDPETHTALQRLAQAEQRPNGEVAAELLSGALARLQTDDQNWSRWQELTPRQQQVTALACLGFTNRQIAARLSISPETVKTHMRNILYKFELHSKAELQRTLAGWDFSSWREIDGESG